MLKLVPEISTNLAGYESQRLAIEGVHLASDLRKARLNDLAETRCCDDFDVESRIPKQKWKQMYRRTKPGVKRYKCATRPEWTRSQTSGKYYWKSILYYEKAGKLRTMVVSVGKKKEDRQKIMSNRVTRKGKKLPWCPKGGPRRGA